MSCPRVALIVYGYPIPSEVFISYAALGLVRSGCAVDIIPINGVDEPAGAPHPVQAELAGAVRVIRAPDPAGGGGAGQAMRSLIARHGVSALAGDRSDAVRSRHLHLRPLLLADALSRGGPYDVVHCQFGTLAAPVLALRRAGLLDARVVVHFRGNDISTFVHRAGPAAYDENLRRGGLVRGELPAFPQPRHRARLRSRAHRRGAVRLRSAPLPVPRARGAGRGPGPAARRRAAGGEEGPRPRGGGAGGAARPRASTRACASSATVRCAARSRPRSPRPTSGTGSNFSGALPHEAIARELAARARLPRAEPAGRRRRRGRAGEHAEGGDGERRAGGRRAPRRHPRAGRARRERPSMRRRRRGGPRRRRSPR